VSVISVLGTKGGAGKTSVSMGVAIWMSKLKPKPVLLIDGDLHVRSVELKMCPVHDVTLADVLAGKKPWEDAVYACELEVDGKTLYPKLAVLPAGGSFLPPMKGDSYLAHLDITKRVFDKMISSLRKQFDTIIIDTPASVSYEHLILTAVADKVLHVCEANDDSIDATFATARGLAQFLDVETAGVVLNKVADEVDVNSWVEKARKIGPVLGVVPSDDAVDRAFRDNLPVVAAYPGCRASLALKKIAEILLKVKMKPAELPERLDRAIEKVAQRVEAEK